MDFLDIFTDAQLKNTTKANIERLADLGFTFRFGHENTLWYDFEINARIRLHVVIDHFTLDEEWVGYTASVKTDAGGGYYSKSIYAGQDFGEMLEEIMK